MFILKLVGQIPILGWLEILRLFVNFTPLLGLPYLPHFINYTHFLFPSNKKRVYNLPFCIIMPIPLNY